MIIPLRSNGQIIKATWFNVLKNIIEGVLSPNAISQTTFSIADNRTSLTSITNLVFSSANVLSARVFYSIYRTDGTIERRETGHLTVRFSAISNAWTWARESSGDNALNFNDSLIVNSAGQVQYLSDSMAGTYSGNIKYKVLEVIDA